MPRIKYLDKRFTDVQLSVIKSANSIVNEYVAQGYALTLRGLYYVFVGRKLFPDEWRYKRLGADKWVKDPDGTTNATPNYKNLGKIVTDARMAGLLDWLALDDLERSSHANQHWSKPSDMVRVAMGAYAIDKWSNQRNHVEVWVEKKGLLQIVSTVCRPMDVRYYASKGYSSGPALWEAGQRLLDKIKQGREPHILYAGDHDPSGMDIPRDIKAKLTLFCGRPVHVQRLALNIGQIQSMDLPSDPAKSTDPRFKDYQEKFGDESWELEAMDAAQLADRVRRGIMQFRDEDKWKEAVEEEEKGLRTLQDLRDNFPDVVVFLRALKASQNP